MLTWNEAYTGHTRREGMPAIADLDDHRDGFRAGWLDAGLGYTSTLSRVVGGSYSDGYNAGQTMRGNYVES